MGGRGRPEHSCIISFETSPALFGTVQLLYDQVIIYPVRPVSSPVQPLLYWCWPRSARHLTRPLNQSGTLDIFLDVAFSLYFEIKGWWQCSLHGIGNISETIAFIVFTVCGNQWKHLKGWLLQALGMVSSLLHVAAAGFCSSLLHSHATPDLTTPVANFSAQKCPNYP